MADLLNRVGRSAFNYLAGQDGYHESGFIGSIVEVEGMQVQVTKLLGEGGYAFIYAAKEITTGKQFALKRFLVVEEQKIQEVKDEIRLMKEMKDNADFVRFVTAAHVDHSEGKKINKEYLLLMELCGGGDLAQLLRKSGESLSPANVCVVMGCLTRALQALHGRKTPVIHRDIKLENLLVTKDNFVKLCDLGSATTTTHTPNPNWTMNQRTMLEDELAKYSTPMYRAPEMLDTWSNFPVNQALDIWAAGLVLYSICFNKHPFEDSNKLAIVNGNYKIPPTDSKYRMYHLLIKSMLSLDPKTRPTAGEVLDQLSAIAETHGFLTKGALSISSPIITPESVQDPNHGPPLPSGPIVDTPDSQQTSVSAFKASAGSLFSKLKDTSKAVVASVQQSMAGRDLDFHCITSRVAAMSFPADGFESAYRNHIDDVRGMMESQHSEHYTVFNVSERCYHESKYPTGKLVQAGWPVGTVPSLDSTLDLCASILDFLSRDVRNVVVVHCLDGKTSTAYTVCALLLYTGLVTTLEAAQAIFSGKRCTPVLTSGQVASLKHLGSLIASKPPVLKSPFVTVTNLVIEPIPLLNKAGDGCRPYVELFQGKERLVSSLQEYSRMKGYSVTTGDEAATLPINMTVCGDVTIVVNHARQALGALKPIRICQVQFHTSSLTPGRPSYSWTLDQLDGLADLARYSDSFRIVLNCTTSEECSGRNIDWPDNNASTLLFNSDQDHESVLRLLPQTDSSHHIGQSNFFVNNPEFEGVPNVPLPTSTAFSSVSPTSPASSNASVDLLGLSDQNHQSDLLPGFSAPREPTKNAPSNVNLMEPTPPANTGQTFDFLADLGQPMPPAPAPNASVPSSSSNSLSDLFGPQSPISTPLLDISAMSRGTSQPDIKKTSNDNFDPFGNLANLSASLSSQNLSASGQPSKMGQSMNSMHGTRPSVPSNLNLGKGFPQPKIVNPNVLGNAVPSQAAPAKQMGPNYSRSFFSSGDNSGTSSQSGGVKPKMSSNTFDDLLGNFNPTSKETSQNQSIGAMKKTELVKSMDPDEAKIFEWKEGKARNIRTLLCSLHKIIWAGARWSECGMHQLVSSADVKKMYRKACLAVHPDKQMGTENENISKLIFMELNEAWSEFENDPNQQNMFG